MWKIFWETESPQSLAEIQKMRMTILVGPLFFVTFCCGLFPDYLESEQYFSSDKLLRAHQKVTYICDLGRQLFVYVSLSIVNCFFFTRLRRLGSVAWTLFEDWLETEMDGRRNYEVVAYKIVWVGLECSKWLSERFLRSVEAREHAWTLRLTHDCLTIHFFLSKATLFL